jgi:hypothetical protein
LLTPAIAAIASLAGVYFQRSSLGLRQRVKQLKKIRRGSCVTRHCPPIRGKANLRHIKSDATI